MSAAIEVGSGTQQQMSVRVNQSHKLSPFGLPTAKVGFPILINAEHNTNSHFADANLFKEAFIKAQQDNEALFKEE